MSTTCVAVAQHESTYSEGCKKLVGAEDKQDNNGHQEEVEEERLAVQTLVWLHHIDRLIEHGTLELVAILEEIASW